jgi:nitrous oxidase accessory protein NosD
MAIHIAPTLEVGNPFELFREGPHLNMFITGAPILADGESGILGVGQLDGRHSVATYKTFADINDRGGAKILAHEWGHNFGLLHTNEDGLSETDEDDLNLMVSFLEPGGFGNARLNASQCERARTSPILANRTASPLTEINVPQDFDTIQSAINAASHGTTINVAAGDYAESIFIDKPLNLVAERGAQVVLRGSERNPETLMIRDTGDAVVQGFSIPNGGVVILNTFQSRFEGNSISGADRGILIQNSQIDLVNNHVSDSNIGILSFGLIDSLIQGNTLVDNHGELGIGLALSISFNISVIGNTISQNDTGLFAESGTTMSLTNNRIINNVGAGVTVTASVIILSCSGNDFSGNSISSSVRTAC